MARKAYDASSIQVLDPLEGVRTHPGMYLGSTDTHGTFQMLKEVLDNAKDELNHRGSGRILVTINKEVITVADDGRGVPVDIHKKTKKSALETVFTRLHAGAKSGNKSAYGKETIGVHGVGAAVTNALSTKFQVWTYRNKKWHTQSYVGGVPQDSVKRDKCPITWPCGTIVRYVRDSKLMTSELDIASVESYCYLLSHFSNITIKLINNGKTTLYKPQPMKMLVADTVRQCKDDKLTSVFSVTTDNVRLVLIWTASSESFFKTYVNGSPTSGGTHATGFNRVLEETFAKIYKGKAPNLMSLAGLHGVLDVSIDQPSFEGQAKTRLASKQATEIVRSQLEKPLLAFMRQHKSEIDNLVSHLKAIEDATTKSKELMKLALSVKGASRGISRLPIKLMASPNASPDKRELYLLEGDSAAGTARLARLAWQECLPLRGKLPNLIKDGRKALSNAEIHDIVRCIGFDPKKPDAKLRINKLIFLADADVDGDHISVLMMALAYTLMPELIKSNKVFVVKAPLFVAQKGKDYVYGNTLAEIKKHGKVSHVERMKGWGSCSPELLRVLAFDPKTRDLENVIWPSAKDGTKFKLLMGGNSEARKELMDL